MNINQAVFEATYMSKHQDTYHPPYLLVNMYTYLVVNKATNIATTQVTQATSKTTHESICQATK